MKACLVHCYMPSTEAVSGTYSSVQQISEWRIYLILNGNDNLFMHFSLFKHLLLHFVKNMTNISPNYFTFTIHFYSPLKKQLPREVSLEVKHHQPATDKMEKKRASKQTAGLNTPLSNCFLFLTFLSSPQCQHCFPKTQ